MNKFEDHLIFENPDDKSKVIFNCKTFFEIIKGCMIKYGNIPVDKANIMIEQSKLAVLPKTYNDVVFLSHEHEFHWAMIITFGEGYWQKPDYEKFSKIPDGYNEWGKKIIVEKNLAETSFEFL
jgi:hypothetical protein